MCVCLLKQDETDIESEREREEGRRGDKGIDMQIDLRRPLQLENLGMPQFRGIYFSMFISFMYSFPLPSLSIYTLYNTIQRLMSLITNTVTTAITIYNYNFAWCM